MSNTTQEQLLRFFAEAAGTDSGTPAASQIAEPIGGASADAASGTSDAASGQSYAATTVGTSTGAESAAPSTGGTGSTSESALTTFLEGGLGIVPLVTGLIDLFGGGSSAPPDLEKYQKPSSIDFMSADTPNGLVAANYDQLGMPRLADTAQPTSTAPGSSGVSASSAAESDQLGMPRLADAVLPTSTAAGSSGASGSSAANYDQLGMPRLNDTALPISAPAGPLGAGGSSAANYGQLGMPQLADTALPSSTAASFSRGSGSSAADYDQLGMPQLADTALQTSPAASSSGARGSSAAAYGSGAGQGGTAAPQVTVNIQAMDAQSILDRSGDIAQAVRSAMLNMSAINDVISDL